MIDLVCSTLEGAQSDLACSDFKRRAFLAIIDEEKEANRCDARLLEQIRKEVLQRLD